MPERRYGDSPAERGVRMKGVTKKSLRIICVALLTLLLLDIIEVIARRFLR